MSDEGFAPAETHDWEEARRGAFVQQVLTAFTRRPSDLLPFEQVRQKLRLHSVRYLGLQNVPLDQIIGSVGRYQDFSRTFFPRRSSLRERWRMVDRLVTRGGGLPPVELYKVGQAYFVRDGNHRVSVARQHGARSIEAYVWEYETRVPLDPDTNIDDLLCKAAHAGFLERTNIDHLCPEQRIELTHPDGYEDLLYEIEAFQYSLSQIDEREVGLDEAVVLWQEMQYEPIVDIIRERGILQGFPGRTEGDLYLWLRRNQEELELRYGHAVMMDEAAQDLATRFGARRSPARQVRRAVGRLVEGAGAGERAPEEDAVASGLLAPVRRVAAATPPYRFRGGALEQWEDWHTEFRTRLWDLLGVEEREELKVELEEGTPVDGSAGLVRELLWLHTEPEMDAISPDSPPESLRVPAYLFRPAEAGGLRPAILIFPGHGTIAQAAGLDKSPYLRANALELARAGFITLAVEPRGFGRLGVLSHLQIDAAARLVGRTWYGMLVHDALCAIDYLLTRPDVDPARVGAAGIGAGGALAMYTAALDERVHAALVNSYLGKYVITSLDEEHCSCNDIPGILRYAEMGDVAALIGPRPALFVNGRRDPATTLAARESFAVASHVYRLLGVPRRVRLIEPEEMGHYFDNQLAIGWFRRWFGK